MGSFEEIAALLANAQYADEQGEHEQAMAFLRGILECAEAEGHRQMARRQALEAYTG